MSLNANHSISVRCPSGCRAQVRRRGKYFRKSEARFAQRYHCPKCQTSFSQTLIEHRYRDRKPGLRRLVRGLLASGVSQRRGAILVHERRRTFVRYFIEVGKWSKTEIHEANSREEPCRIVQFDDLETFEHTKCKPLSVTLFVQEESRRILGYCVSRMPAKGKLAKLSRNKYGPRIDERAKNRHELLVSLKPLIADKALFKSDMNPHYKIDIKKHFPEAQHEVYKGRRGCVTGQGELKAGGKDPLFSLNHSCAMLRANINRLFRRTWNTTKRPDRLDLHIAIYAHVHNAYLIDNPAK